MNSFLKKDNLFSKTYELEKPRRNSILGEVSRILLAIWKKHLNMERKQSDFFPINLNEVAEHLNVVICEEQFVVDDIEGIFDGEKIIVNMKLSPKVKRFTIAHEMGHLLLHCGPSQKKVSQNRSSSGAIKRQPLFRSVINDRGILRSKLFPSQSNYRLRQYRLRKLDYIPSSYCKEYEADFFAKELLMPQKTVCKEFALRFEKGNLADFELLGFDLQKIKTCINGNDNLIPLAKSLSTTNTFNGKIFLPLVDIFGVSSLAMAIRLKELKLVKRILSGS